MKHRDSCKPKETPIDMSGKAGPQGTPGPQGPPGPAGPAAPAGGGGTGVTVADPQGNFVGLLDHVVTEKMNETPSACRISVASGSPAFTTPPRPASLAPRSTGGSALPLGAAPLRA